MWVTNMSARTEVCRGTDNLLSTDYGTLYPVLLKLEQATEIVARILLKGAKA